MVVKRDELVQYIAEQVVRRMETPREERKQARLQKKKHTSWSELWFGMIPFAFRMWKNDRRKRKKAILVQPSFSVERQEELTQEPSGTS